MEIFVASLIATVGFAAVYIPSSSSVTTLRDTRNEVSMETKNGLVLH